MSHLLCATCQSNMVTHVKLLYESQFGPHLLIWFDFSPKFFKKISISCAPNLDRILLLYNLMIIFIKIDIFIKYFNNIKCI